tara:strand:- start:480 stop:767 length:288 start_codon:yes stop_codon:yes gene_type:complete
MLTFGLYNRVDLMSQALIDAVAKQTLKNQELQKSIDDIEQPDIDDAVDTYLTNNFCPSDWELVEDGDIDYKIEQSIDELRDELESKIDELESDKE